MKIVLPVLLILSISLHAQTITRRQTVSLPNNYAPAAVGYPIGFNVKDNGNLLFYWSQAVKGTLRDDKKQDRRFRTLLNNLLDADKDEEITALPLVTESEYDTLLKYVGKKEALVSSASLSEQERYTFNGAPIEKDAYDLPYLFLDFPYKPNEFPVSKAALTYTGKGLLGEKDKSYYPIYIGQGFSFSAYGTPIFSAKGYEHRKAENQQFLEGLVPKKADPLIYLPGAKATQAIFHSANEPEKFGRLKNYQFITWDKDGNVLNKVAVTLPFAYEPEGVAIVDQQQQGKGFFYLCKRAENAKGATNPDESAYYILAFDEKGNQTMSYETSMGTEDCKIDFMEMQDVNFNR